jgi:hypothetical protein
MRVARGDLSQEDPEDQEDLCQEDPEDQGDLVPAAMLKTAIERK